MLFSGMRNWLFPSVITILLASCSEPNNPGDPPPPGGDTCHYFADSVSNDITAQWVYPENMIVAVSMNPNNTDEFAYIQHHVQNNTYSVRKYNAATGTDTWLADFPVLLRSLSWSRQGYIFNNTSHELHRIKEDGSSHDVFTYGAILTRPVCSPNGEMVAIDFVTFNPSAGYCAILDKNGNFIDSIEPGGQIMFSWIDDEHILFWGYSNTYKIININTKTVMEQGDIAVDYLAYALDNTGNFTTNIDMNIGIYNLFSKSITILHERCGDNYRYQFCSGVKGLYKTICLRQKYNVIDSAQRIYSYSTDVVALGLDGSEEQVLLNSE